MARGADVPPTLKRDKARGYYYTRWGGRLFTFGKDEHEAKRKFLDPQSEHAGALHRWQVFANAKAQRAVRTQGGSAPLLIDIAEEFFATYDDRPDTRRYYRQHLKRFLTGWGEMRPDVINEDVLDAFRADLLKLKFAPKTVSHDLKAIKTFWRYARQARRSYVPALELSEIRVPRQAEPTPHPVSIETIEGMVEKAARASPPDGLLGECIRLSYLAFLRPSELVRIVSGEGQFAPIVYPISREDRRGGIKPLVVPRGLLVIQSKVGHRTGSPRYVVLSEGGLLSVERVRGLASVRRSAGLKLWTRLDSYSSAVRSATGHPPSVLRDSAASDLHAMGEDWGTCDQLLGHLPAGAGRSYTRIAWHVLREAAGQLTL